MIKKTFSQILEDLDANFPETFFALMMDECTSYYDTVLIYSFYDGKTRIETVPFNDRLVLKRDEVLLCRFSFPDEGAYEIQDLFSDEEIKEIEEKYEGSIEDYLEAHLETPLIDRVVNAAEYYFCLGWNIFYQEVEEKLQKKEQELLEREIECKMPKFQDILRDTGFDDPEKLFDYMVCGLEPHQKSILCYNTILGQLFHIVKGEDDRIKNDNNIPLFSIKYSSDMDKLKKDFLYMWSEIDYSANEQLLEAYKKLWIKEA